MKLFGRPRPHTNELTSTAFGKGALGALILISTIFVGCATRLTPVGEWGQPIDLHLSSETLKGVRIRIDCAAVNEIGLETTRNLRICPQLERRFEGMGAEIVRDGELAVESGPESGPEVIAGSGFVQNKPDLILTYVEQGSLETTSSALAAFGFVFTSGLIPSLSSATSRAEFRVSDARGVVIDRAPMSLVKTTAFGWGALIAFFGPSERQQEREIGEKVFQFAENRIASQVIRRNADRGTSR